MPWASYKYVMISKSRNGVYSLYTHKLSLSQWRLWVGCVLCTAALQMFTTVVEISAVKLQNALIKLTYVSHKHTAVWEKCEVLLMWSFLTKRVLCYLGWHLHNVNHQLFVVRQGLMCPAAVGQENGSLCVLWNTLLSQCTSLELRCVSWHVSSLNITPFSYISLPLSVHSSMPWSSGGGPTPTVCSVLISNWGKYPQLCYSQLWSHS